MNFAVCLNRLTVNCGNKLIDAVKLHQLLVLWFLYIQNIRTLHTLHESTHGKQDLAVHASAKSSTFRKWHWSSQTRCRTESQWEWQKNSTPYHHQ